MNKRFVIKAALAACAAAMMAGASLAIADVESDGAGLEMPKEVVAAASAFSAYMTHAATVNGRMTSGAEVAEGLKTGAAYEPRQFEEGMIGYAALAALRDQRFLAGIDFAGRREGRRTVVERLAVDPGYVLQIDGAREAAALAQSALRERGEAVAKAGGEAKQAAYEVQAHAWSKAKVVDHVQRLAGVKALSARPPEAAEGDEARLIEAVLHVPTPADSEAARVSPVVVRALALATDTMLGAARPSDLPNLRPLLTETSSAQCLRMSKLNLYQCMAVAGPQYEDVFCLGQHALIDTGHCVSIASGSAP
jgi:hypothetical protein